MKLEALGDDGDDDEDDDDEDDDDEDDVRILSKNRG